MESEVDDDPLANRNRAADLERIKQARKKRLSQLKSWTQYDRMMEKSRAGGKILKTKAVKKGIHFPESLVLLEASGRGDVAEVKQILQGGASPDVCNEDGLTALHQCCIDNNLPICQLLIQYGVNVNSTDSEMWTPLHAAAACAHIDICACLIENGAELLALNAEGNMPYDICEEESTLDLIENAMAVRGISQEDIDERRKMPEMNMLKDLQSQQVDLTKINDQGASFIHIASSCGYLEVGRYLLDREVPVDILDKDGWQAIHVAACWGQLEFIELLLLRGADINAITRSGETVYDICEDPEINQRLLQMKQEIEMRQKNKTQEIKPSRSQLNRRSTLTKRRSSSPDEGCSPQGVLGVGSLRRTTSIRRSSMREKSLMSWKEARQEALIREAVQKQINTDTTPDSEIKSDQKNQGQDKKNVPNNEDIDISQVLVNVQLVTENEIALKEPLVRRGSSRHSFTHSHPYHSPSRDPTLMEESIDEDSSVDDSDDIKKFVPILGGNRSVRKNDQNAVVVPGKDLNSSVRRDPPGTQSNFSRSGDGTASMKVVRPVPNNASIRTKPKVEIENKPLMAKSAKAQGCCLVM